MEKYRTITLEGWSQVGEGGNAITYASDTDENLLLKVEKDKNTLPKIEAEFELNQRVALLGLKIPQVYEIVALGDGCYGTLFQRIKGKKSFSRLCADEPENIENIARIFAQESLSLHATPCDTNHFLSYKALAQQALKRTHLLSRKNRRLLQQTLDNEASDATTCLHGDWYSGNIISAAGENYIIDLGRFGYGDPLFDIGHLYMICVTLAHLPQLEEITHLSKQQSLRFWKAFAMAYFHLDDEAQLPAVESKVRRFLCLRKLADLYHEKSSIAKKLFFAKIFHNTLKDIK